MFIHGWSSTLIGPVKQSRVTTPQTNKRRVCVSSFKDMRTAGTRYQKLDTQQNRVGRHPPVALVKTLEQKRGARRDRGEKWKGATCPSTTQLAQGKATISPRSGASVERYVEGVMPYIDSSTCPSGPLRVDDGGKELAFPLSLSTCKRCAEGIGRSGAEAQLPNSPLVQSPTGQADGVGMASEARKHLMDTLDKLRLAFSGLHAFDGQVAALTAGADDLSLSEVAARVQEAAGAAKNLAAGGLKVAGAAEVAASKAAVIVAKAEAEADQAKANESKVAQAEKVVNQAIQKAAQLKEAEAGEQVEQIATEASEKPTDSEAAEAAGAQVEQVKAEASQKANESKAMEAAEAPAEQVAVQGRQETPLTAEAAGALEQHVVAEASQKTPMAVEAEAAAAAAASEVAMVPSTLTKNIHDMPLSSSGDGISTARDTTSSSRVAIEHGETKIAVKAGESDVSKDNEEDQATTNPAERADAVVVGVESQHDHTHQHTHGDCAGEHGKAKEEGEQGENDKDTQEKEGKRKIGSESEPSPASLGGADVRQPSSAKSPANETAKRHRKASGPTGGGSAGDRKVAASAKTTPATDCPIGEQGCPLTDCTMRPPTFGIMGGKMKKITTKKKRCSQAGCSVYLSVKGGGNKARFCSKHAKSGKAVSPKISA